MEYDSTVASTRRLFDRKSPPQPSNTPPWRGPRDTGNMFADLREIGAAATRTAGRRWINDTSTRQVVREVMCMKYGQEEAARHPVPAGKYVTGHPKRKRSPATIYGGLRLAGTLVLLHRRVALLAMEPVADILFYLFDRRGRPRPPTKSDNSCYVLPFAVQCSTMWRPPPIGRVHLQDARAGI
jgi:hypothetical protein